MRPVIFYTIGYPGAGKTTFAKALSGYTGSVHLRGDQIGFKLFRFPTYSEKERQAVNSEMERRAIAAIKSGKHVLYDRANNSKAQRMAVIQLAQRLNCNAIGVWVQTPKQIAKERASKIRDKDIIGSVARIVPPALFEQYVANFQEPHLEKGIVIISGTSPFSLQYRRLQRQIVPYNIQLPRIIS